MARYSCSRLTPRCLLSTPRHGQGGRNCQNGDPGKAAPRKPPAPIQSSKDKVLIGRFPAVQFLVASAPSRPTISSAGIAGCGGGPSPKVTGGRIQADGSTPKKTGTDLGKPNSARDSSLKTWQGDIGSADAATRKGDRNNTPPAPRIRGGPP